MEASALSLITAQAQFYWEQYVFPQHPSYVPVSDPGGGGGGGGCLQLYIFSGMRSEHPLMWDGNI